MKTLFWILGVIALLVLLGGALNHGTQVSLDYLVGSTPGVSLFWFALGVGAGVLLAGLAGWSVGRAGGGDTRAKLERELESTYRRLRECEARLPVPAAPVVDLTPTAVVRADDAVTAVAPTSPDDAVTAVAQAPVGEADTVVTAAEAETAEAPAPDAEAETTEAPAPDAEAETPVTPVPAGFGEADVEDAPAS